MDIKSFAMGYTAGEGAATPDLVDLEATSNGTYNHSGHDGYDQVVVNVANSYVAGDEGKVVSNGALVSQTSTTKNANGTYDTTTNNQVVVNVEPDLEDITITQNGTYTHSGKDGYDEVVVNVSGGLDCGVAFTKTNGVITGANVIGVSGVAPSFTEMDTLQTVTFGEGITQLPANCCNNVPTLTSVTLPSTLTTIGSAAFQNCYNISAITIPTSVTQLLGMNNFRYCTKLTSIDLKNISTLPSSAFNSCTALTSVVGNEVTQINNAAFGGCNTLTTLSFPKVTIIENNAFESCNALTTFSLPKVTTIGNTVFRNCKGLTTVTLPNTITSIGTNVFQNCTNLTDIYVPWAEGAISGAPWGAPSTTTIHYNS